MHPLLQPFDVCTILVGQHFPTFTFHLCLGLSERLVDFCHILSFKLLQNTLIGGHAQAKSGIFMRGNACNKKDWAGGQILP